MRPSRLILAVLVPALGIGGPAWAGDGMGPGMVMLPVTLAGMTLVMLGLALIVAEAFVPSFGALGLLGGLAVILGFCLLLQADTPLIRVSLPAILGTAAVLALALLVVVVAAVRARRRPIASGEENAAGRPVTVIDWTGTSGVVLHHGERWQAVGPAGLSVGQTVIITKRDGLTLGVAPAVPEGA